MDNKETASTPGLQVPVQGLAPAVYSVVMPRLGLTMTEARITEWLQPEGAWVEKGAALFVLEHEKATLEIEAPASGRLHILVPVEVVVPILTPIALLDQGDPLPRSLFGPASAGQTAGLYPKGTQEAEPTPTDAAPALSDRVRATPKARALARRQGVSLQGLPGSGPRGMLTSSDVPAPLAGPGLALAGWPANASPVAIKVAQDLGVDLTTISGSGPRGQVMRRDVEQRAASASPRAASASPSAATPAAASLPHPLAGLTGLRSVIAQRLSASWVERPQVTLTTEADATYLVALRQQIQAEWNLKISYNAILVKCVAQALREQPNLNVQLTPAGLVVLPEINIGVAVDTQRGLMVPVLRQANTHTLFEIHDLLQGLAQRALEGRSLPDELSGGSFTITNLGMYEIDAFTPILNPPECAILGVGRIVSKPVGLNGQIVLREMITLSLSFDHRLVDGAPAARFLQRIKTLIGRSCLIGLEK